MRVFIAADISDELRERIGKIQSEFKRRLKNQNGIKWVRPQLIHLTLKFLGEVDEGRTDEICQTLEMVCEDTEAFELEFAKLGCFGRPPKVIWLGLEQQVVRLQKLAGDLENAFEMLGFEKEGRDFSPHLTLARVNYAGSGKELARTIESFGKVDAPKVKVDAVCVYKSQLTSDGPIYTLLHKTEF